MRLVSSSKMKQLDILASVKFGIPSLVLMENAGRSAVELILKSYNNKKGCIWIFCGYGNNGGDGFVVARHLLNRGIRVMVFLVGKKKSFSQESHINYHILTKLDCKIKKISNYKSLKTIRAKGAALIVDAIFGIGLKGHLNDFYRGLIQWINNQRVSVFSLDIPSGLDADKGIPLPIAVKARQTLTFGIVKKGLIKKSAEPFVGKLNIGDISLPAKLARGK